jgi:hypothetical protein
MRIHVSAPTGLATPQMRAYAEYRVFASLARFGEHVRSATVTLNPAAAGADRGVICLVDIDVGGGSPLRCRSAEPHAADAIDRAADRSRRALERRLASGRHGFTRGDDKDWRASEA